MQDRLPPGHVLVVERLRVETSDRRPIVSDVSMTVHAGEVLALVGESGSGKTSTALALLGFAREGTEITGGSVLLGQQNLRNLKWRELQRLRGARIAYVPQDPTSGLNPRHRIGAQIAETLLVHGVKKKVAHSAVGELVERVHLPHEQRFLDRYPFELSGGQQQRVAIAMALVSKPLVVVLDEPTTGLDVTTQAHILDLLRELSQETLTAFVYVTHDLAVVDGLADTVLVMYAGEIVEGGPRDAVFARPAHPYTSLLLASVPRLSVRQALAGIPGAAPVPGAGGAGCAFAPRCPLADERTRNERPRLEEIAAGHFVRCFHAFQYAAQSTSARAVTPAPSADQPVLAISHLVAAYGTGFQKNLVLQDVSLSLNRGECLALVGESGSGKTTLGRCVVGLHRPESGAISHRGVSLAATAAERPRRERQFIQIVFQNPDRSLNPAHTIFETLSRPLKLFRLVEKQRERQHLVQLLERVQLPERMLDRYPRELSGGERQRVAIARALAAQPDVLVCDEITSALDVSIQAAIVDILDDLRREGLALLFITHNLALVNSIADQVVVLESGVVREAGETHELISHPKHTYTRTLLAAAPEIGVRGGHRRLPAASRRPEVGGLR